MDQGPNSIVLGDVDGDGDLDVLTSKAKRTLDVRLNNGRGVFGSSQETSLGSGTYRLATCDVDGDGDLDVLTSSMANGIGRVNVRLNQVQPAPVITRLTPSAGPVGTSVVITGTTFNGATSVTFNGIPAVNFEVDSPTQLTAAVPLGATTGPVVVTTSAGASNGVLFTVNPPLQVTSLSPARNAVAAPRGSNVAVGFNQLLANTTPTQQALRVFSSQAGGQRTGTATVSGNQLIFDPSTNFKPGETVQATLRGTAQSSTGLLANPHVFQFTTATTPSAALFTGGTDPSVGIGPVEVLTGDVDGDGDLDLLTANQNSGTISVLRNQGAGTFAGRQDLSTDQNPQAAALADLDQDGDLDLLVSSAPFPAPGSSVRVWRNDGQGSFRAEQQFGVGNSPVSLAVGDVDGDGDLDVFIANSASNTVSMRLNNGAAVFSGGQEVEVGSQPNAVVTGDVDGDGDLDVLTANRGSRSISVRFNEGAFFSSVGQQVAVGAEPINLTLGDLDRDGDLDLVAANYFDNSLSVRFNDGTGFFSGGQQLAVGPLPRRVVLGDIDGDGDLDVLTALMGLNNLKVSVQLNNGRGGFQLHQEVPVNVPIGLALGDVDNNGTLDLLTTAFGSDQVSVRLNQMVLATANAAVAAQISLYPNPVQQDVVQLRVPSHLARQGAAVRLLNNLGQVVREQPWSAAHPEIWLGPLSPGIYSVHIETHEGAVTKRLVVR